MGCRIFYVLVIGLLCPAFIFGTADAADKKQKPVAGIVQVGLKGEDAELIQSVEQELEKAGYDTSTLDYEALCDKSKLNTDAVDLLVFPNAGHLPAASVTAINAYASSGGNILALKAPLWQEQYYRDEGKWLTRNEYQLKHASDLPPHIIFDFDPSDIQDWKQDLGPREGKGSIETVANGPAPNSRALHIISQIDDGWDIRGPRQIEDPFPNGHDLTVFSAKGAPQTSHVYLEWRENDGSRWYTSVGLDPEWKQYVLYPEDFKMWTGPQTRRGTTFRPYNAKTLYFGLAKSHIKGLPKGKHEYWIGPLGTASSRKANAPKQYPIPALDTLSPTYKLFECNDVSKLIVRQDQAILPQEELSVPREIRSPHPRPRGAGFRKQRRWRWIPLLEAQSPDGEWRGTPVTLLVHGSGVYQGASWASFGIQDTDWYKQEQVLQMIGRLARRMRDGVYMLDGGAACYTHFEDQEVELGLTTFAPDQVAERDYSGRITVRDGATDEKVFEYGGSVKCDFDLYTLQPQWTPETWPEEGYECTAELLADGQVVDRVVHDIHVWKPSKEKHFVEARDGGFFYKGKRWRANGINYMPSSGIAFEDGEYFEYWLSKQSYDPEVIQRDLEHVKEIGFNSIAIFVYHRTIEAQNLLDILRRCEKLGLKVNLSLRPGTPMDFQWEKIKAIIEYYRLWEHDNIIAFDIAWEPTFGDQQGRKTWDDQWQQWIVERYGSIENAEKDWEFEVPRDADGDITNPNSKQVMQDGPWRRMVAAYRRFLDTLIYKKYSAARRLIRQLDPHHPVSFRMANAGNPTWEAGVLCYDFPYLAAAVDIIEPEAYGRVGDWNKIKPGIFENAYIRWAAPELPLLWAEAGTTVWDTAAQRPDPEQLDFQAEYYANIYRMLSLGRADGIYFWWYPGGFRANEDSDYGIINPDGTDRPVTKVIRDKAEGFMQAPYPEPVEHWIRINRDRHPSGLSGIYKNVKEEFWRAFNNDQWVGLRTAGTGTNSATCPLVAVGNVPCDGSNPPRYLDGVFDWCKVKTANGQWVTVKDKAKLKVAADRPVKARMQIRNLAEAAWLNESPSNDGHGRVILRVDAQNQQQVELPQRVHRHEAVILKDVELAGEDLTEPAKVTLSLEAIARTPFGEKLTFTLVPVDR